MGMLSGLFGNNASKNKNNKKNKNVVNAVVAEEVVVNPSTGNQTGGVAPVGMKADFFQPTKAVGYWAVAADAPTPPADQMRNVAHGGARKKSKSHKKHKKSKKGKSHKKSRKQKKSRKHKKSLKHRK